MPQRQQLRSDIAWSTPDRIFVKGFDLCEDILGKLSLGDMAFLELMDRLPSPQESTVFNALAARADATGAALARGRFGSQRR